MPNIFEVTDPRGRTVICTEAQWNDHILRQHPDMQGWEQEVSTTIKQPDFNFIYQDAHHSNRNIYYRRHQGRKFYIKVVVEFVEEEVGRVVTAFLTISGKKGEILIWPKSNP